MTQANKSETKKPNRRGVVGVVPRGDRLLVICRSQSVEAPGAFCFPGGAIEGAETEIATLRRELHEELGVAARPIRRLWQSRTDWNVDLAWWLADLDPGERLEPRPSEVASVHWLTLEEIRRLPRLLSSNRQFIDAFQRGEFSLGLSDTEG
jgi:8-oxo-dGTP diphosphatase